MSLAIFKGKNVYLIASFLVSLVAILHLGFLIMEMFLWKKPIGLKIFRIDAQFAEKSAALAANQGLYNGFLSAGLFWSLCANPEMAIQLKFFFLGCVVIAGIYGAVTVGKNILFIQALPAALALVAVWWS